jgi:hypothetical protein
MCLTCHRLMPDRRQFFSLWLAGFTAVSAVGESLHWPRAIRQALQLMTRLND